VVVAHWWALQVQEPPVGLQRVLVGLDVYGAVSLEDFVFRERVESRRVLDITGGDLEASCVKLDAASCAKR
jgi:hypothetical protein